MMQTPLASGYGQFHTDKTKPLSTINLDQIKAMLSAPQNCPKDQAQWVIFSDVLTRSKDLQRANNARFYALWSDIDNMQGVSLPDLVKQMQGILKCEIWAYNTKSATPENQKARLVIPLAEPIVVGDFILCQTVVNSAAQKAGVIPDEATQRPAQICYLPNRGAYYEHIIADSFSPADPLTQWKAPLDKLKDIRQKEEAERLQRREQSRRKAIKAMTSGMKSPIDAFNASYDLHTLLIGYGYTKAGKDRYLSPDSTSGKAGLTIDQGRYVTAHQSDITAGLKKAGDPFDLFVHYEHSGDFNSALKAAGEMFTTTEGVTLTRANQRAYMESQSRTDTPAISAISAIQGDYDAQIDHAPPAISAISAIQWGEYKPLLKPIREPNPYPVDDLGSVLAPLAIELSETVKAPLPLISNSLMATAGLVSQGYANIKLLHGASVPISIFAATVGDSGERKTGIDEIVLSPVNARQRALGKQYKKDLQEYESKLEAYESTKKDKRKKLAAAEVEVPQKPISSMIICSDPTPEGLFKQLKTGQPSTGIFTDEGGLFTSGFAMQDQTKLATMSRLSKLWSGDKFDRVRGGDGLDVLYDRRLSVHLMMQGLVADTIFSDDVANAQGFLARFLVAYPKTTAGTRFFTDRDPRESVAFKRYYKVMSDILETPLPVSDDDPQEITPETLQMTTAARSMLIAYHDQIEADQAPNGRYAHIRPMASKIIEHACRIAGVLMVIEHGATVAADGMMIDQPEIERAIRIAQWYLDEWDRIATRSIIPPHISLAKLLHEWVLGDKNPHAPFFYSTQALQFAPNKLRDKDTLNTAIKTLAEHGVLRESAQMLLDGKMRAKVYEVREPQEPQEPQGVHLEN